MSEPTPVISSTKHIDSGSSSAPKFTCRPPTGTQENPATCSARCSLSRLKTSVDSTTPTPNAPTGRCAARPTAAPRHQTAAGPTAATPVVPSVLQQTGIVDRGRPAGTEDRHDDRQADHDLACGDHHREEGHHLTVELTVHPGERDERQIRGIEHQLDTHEHHDRVAPQQDTG